MKQGNTPTRPIALFKSGKKAEEPLGKGSSGKLIVIYGAHLGKQYELGPKRTLIGRTDRSDIIIDDSSVSREHASIERKDGRFILEDLKSTNGTFINSEFVDVCVLNHGDKIRIGNTVLQFIVERS
ncbi:MAG: FHA domain-containing protein [Proteobacteria bacterium]|nr:FHA domain-containing protein [Pseudomonadota bacterium]